MRAARYAALKESPAAVVSTGCTTCGGGISAGLCSRTVHFGLAKNTVIDTVKVRWVQGTVANAAPQETVSGVAPNGIYRIVQGSGAATKLK